MRFAPDARTIQPIEVINPGLFIPLPQEMTAEQLAAVNDVSRMLGQAGLHGFDVDPASDKKVLQYDPEAQGSLGMMGYEEVMNYFSPLGLETDREYDAAWRALRGTSGRIARDQEKWQAYKPLRAQQEQLVLNREATVQKYWEMDEADRASQGSGVWDKVSEIDKPLRQLERQIREIKGQSQHFPHDPLNKPFIFVSLDWDTSRPLERSENKIGDPTYVPDESTVLHLDNLYSNALKGLQTVHVAPNPHINILLAKLLNDRIAAAQG